ncbi:hypothetical protein ACHAW6_001983 [Cyclotella cf. meneghiniana]
MTSIRKRHHDELANDHHDSSTPISQTTPLQDIPTTHHYAVSYMHRSTVTHSCVSLRHGYVLTGSTDGVVKFWKRSAAVSPAASTAASTNQKENPPTRCLEFVKSYISHAGPLAALVCSSPDGNSAASVGFADGTVKFYDVASFDVAGMIRTGFPLGRAAVLLEREEGILLVSVRARTKEELREREKRMRGDKNNDDDDDDGPNPNSDKDKSPPPGSILIFSSTTLSPEPLRIVSYHASPVTSMAYHSQKQWIVSGDVSGVLEVWNVSAAINASNGNNDDYSLLPFQSKIDTDLYALMKKKTYAIDIAIAESSHGNRGLFAIYSTDRKIRLFSLPECKLLCIYDERMKVYDGLFASKSKSMGIDAIEYGNRAALEREMEDACLFSGGMMMNPTTKQTVCTLTSHSDGSHHQLLRMSFDNTGKYLLLPTIVGIKVINIRTNAVVATVGKGDASSLRFLHVCLCPGDAKVDQQLQLARMGGSSAAISHKTYEGSAPPNDSLIIALAYGKRRFYAFSHHDPLLDEEHDAQQSRDVLNEPPDASDLLEASHLGRSDNDFNAANAKLTTATTAILRTTHGDITIKLFPKETPKTIQNFIGHAQSGYYDNVIFHRIIPGFMIQTGDPLGDGTGGESIWGGEFEDEIRRELRHDRPFTVSMANAGPNTNGSQFFITTVPTPWLDNKHTVFGRVTGGMEVVMSIEGVKTDDLDRPLTEVKILSVDVS